MKIVNQELKEKVLQLFRDHKGVIETIHLQTELHLNAKWASAIMRHLHNQGLVRNIGDGRSLSRNNNGTKYSLIEMERVKTVICKVCGKEFEQYASRVKKGRGKYCSLDCRYKDVNPESYKKLQVHSERTKYGHIGEHRFVMEKHLGRELTKEEVVHHIDGNKRNNDISNLMLFANSVEHIKHHARLRKRTTELIHD